MHCQSRQGVINTLVNELMRTLLVLTKLAALVAYLATAAPSARAQQYSARDRDFYWYGIGAGIAITVCELKRNGDVSKGFARRFILDARSNKDIQKHPKTVEALIDSSRSRNCKGL